MSIKPSESGMLTLQHLITSLGVPQVAIGMSWNSVFSYLTSFVVDNQFSFWSLTDARQMSYVIVSLQIADGISRGSNSCHPVVWNKQQKANRSQADGASTANC